ncbi:MAG TPA: hypothetical protein VMU25_02855 [Candidatus Paceibacterota bacterium]|nr:hypothetical protein [Candidatus Paceibacterota bacterium]
MSVPMTKDVTALTANLTAELLLGKIRLNPHHGEPRYLHGLRRVLMPISKSLGYDGLNMLVAHGKTPVHVAVAMIADKVVGFQHPKTLEQLKSLATPHRVAVEKVVSSVTGGNSRDTHWPEELWAMKKMVTEIVDTSPSGLTAEDIRLGYDDLIHAVVDALLERWEMLIN